MSFESAEDALNDVAFNVIGVAFAILVIIIVRFFSHPRKWMFVPVAYIVAAITMISMNLCFSDAVSSSLGAAMSEAEVEKLRRKREIYEWLCGINPWCWILAWCLITMFICCLFYPLWKKIKDKWLDILIAKSGKKIAAILLVLGSVNYALNILLQQYAQNVTYFTFKYIIAFYWPVLLACLFTFASIILIYRSNKKLIAMPFFMAPVIMSGLFVILELGESRYIIRSVDWLNGTLLSYRLEYIQIILAAIYVLTVIFLAIRIVSGKTKIGWIPLLGAQLTGIISVIKTVVDCNGQYGHGKSIASTLTWLTNYNYLELIRFPFFDFDDIHRWGIAAVLGRVVSFFRHLPINLYIGTVFPVFIYLLPALGLIVLAKHYSLKESYKDTVIKNNEHAGKLVPNAKTLIYEGMTAPKDGKASNIETTEDNKTTPSINEACYNRKKRKGLIIAILIVVGIVLMFSLSAAIISKINETRQQKELEEQQAALENSYAQEDGLEDDYLEDDAYNDGKDHPEENDYIVDDYDPKNYRDDVPEKDEDIDKAEDNAINSDYNYYLSDDIKYGNPFDAEMYLDYIGNIHEGDFYTSYEDSNLSVSASTMLLEENYNHAPECAFDNDRSTSWVEGADGLGIDQYLMVNLGKPIINPAVILFGGYQGTLKQYTENGHPTVVTVYYNLKNTLVATETIELCYYLGGETDAFGCYSCPEEDIRTKNYFASTETIVADTITIEITDAIAGTKYEDVCISEVKIEGRVAEKQ